MSSKTALAPALYYHPEKGQLIALASFNSQFRGFVEEMIALEEMQCFAHHQNLYVPLSDIEPYSVTDLDEEFGDKMIPPDPLFGTFSVLAQLRKSKAIPAMRSRLPKLPTQFSHSLDLRVASSNPFCRKLVALNVLKFWSDVAFVSANTASEAEATQVREAYQKLAAEPSSGGFNDKLGLFHKLLLAIAIPEPFEKFDWLWSAGRGRLSVPREQQTDALDILKKFTWTFSGYRWDLEGSEGPRCLIGQYLQLAELVEAD